MSLQSEAGMQKGWGARYKSGEFFVHKDGLSKAYGVGKHSTRSKYRGYFIDQWWFTITGKRTIRIAKNLTRTELIAWVKLLKDKQ